MINFYVPKNQINLSTGLVNIKYKNSMSSTLKYLIQDK